MKPVVYFGALLLGAGFFRSSERPAPRRRRLALIALGRAVAGMGVGPIVFLGVAAAMGRSAGAGLVGLALAGFGLWFAAGKLAFRGARDTHLVVFAITAEVVSLAMDSLLSALNGDFKFC